MAEWIWMRVQREVVLHSEVYSLLCFKNIFDDSRHGLRVPNARRMIEDKAVTHMCRIMGIN
jgi:hypothetical protein